MKLAIIDLDGVCVDSSARFAKAEEAKAAYLADKAEVRGLAQEPFFGIDKKATDLYWRTAFTPDLVQLDTLMDGAVKALAQLTDYAGYTRYFLTSRPETMREATGKWLVKHEVINFWHDKLIMKPLSQQFVKTPVWKAGTIEVLARLLQPDDLLVIDDEHAQQLQADLAGLDCFKVTCVASLAEAVAKIGV